MVKPPTTTVDSVPTESGYPLQSRAVDAAALAGFASTQQAERLARLEADRELILQLQLHSFEGPPWRKFVTALAEYAVEVVKAWALTGKMFQECKHRGLGLGVVRPIRSKDDALELAGETVTRALIAYREKVLIPGRWDPTRGASLRTFFIGQCVYQFANVYRRWAREDPTPNAEAVEAIEAPPSPSIGTMIDLRREWDALSPNDVRCLKAGVEAGYSAAEIAELTNVSRRSVESRLFRDHRTSKKKL